MDFGDAVRQFYGNYTNPQGRAQRSAYWWVVLYRTILITVLCIVILMAEGGAGFYETILDVKTPKNLQPYGRLLGLAEKLRDMDF